MTRRNVITGALLVSPLARSLAGLSPASSGDSRSQSALQLHQHAAVIQSKRPIVLPATNSDETSLPNWIGCFAKGLPQNQFGEVAPTAYRALLDAVNSGRDADFERIPKGAGRKLSNPEAAFTFHLEGGDSHQFGLPPGSIDHLARGGD
jgi:hypothetical protein